ncbi:dna-directed rna polymerase ii subunit 9 [Lentinula edodes]|uniref:Dna-directed rna polymerase ii subunit 9 n=1 Tax=Lentinula edodes TaxID=5353 RepID=A0A1Q3E8E2_LENED|nr:dna-directed rna polymerase ii subunit 9 [Lentinula edodes]
MASLQFCSECNNLLYPKADPHRRIMVFACRICQYEEASENKCVYRNDLLTVTKTSRSNDRPWLRSNPVDSRHIPTLNVRGAGMRNQSKRKETRMILFFFVSWLLGHRCSPEIRLRGADNAT